MKIDHSTANAASGATLYEEHCAYCHGENGEGDEDNPPVWGDHSYNAGAGFARNEKLSAWLKVAMPLDDPILTKQQALDVAAYLNSKPRPKFHLENHLPPAEKLGEYNADLQNSDKIN